MKHSQTELSKMSLEEIKQEYSDSMFFLDEAHRMRNYGDSDKEDVNIYTNMWKLLHVTERTKIVIGTATPLVNSVNDFVPLMNLLLPSNFSASTEKLGLFKYYSYTTGAVF